MSDDLKFEFIVRKQRLLGSSFWVSNLQQSSLNETLLNVVKFDCCSTNVFLNSMHQPISYIKEFSILRKFFAKKRISGIIKLVIANIVSLEKNYIIVIFL